MQVAAFRSLAPQFFAVVRKNKIGHDFRREPFRALALRQFFHLYERIRPQIDCELDAFARFLAYDFDYFLTQLLGR